MVANKHVTSETRRKYRDLIGYLPDVYRQGYSMHETTADDEASQQLEKFVVDPYFAPLMADSLAGALCMIHMNICSLCTFGCVYACDVATDSELYSRATSKYESLVYNQNNTIVFPGSLNFKQAVLENCLDKKHI